MNISLNWLKYYVDIDVPVQELCDKMVMAGFEVESIVDLSQTMKNVVAGKIVKIEKHPDADKLQICQIDVGTGEDSHRSGQHFRRRRGSGRSSRLSSSKRSRHKERQAQRSGVQRYALLGRRTLS